MYDWRKKERNNNPNSNEVQFELNKYIKKRCYEVESWEKVILNECKNKKVLDIGGIAHNLSRINDTDWKHKKIKEVAEDIVGVDILKEMIDILNKRGYNFIFMDAASEGYLGEKFDVVLLGDIIEHMDNLKGILDFARRHLKENGCILITTPNPFYLEYFISFLTIFNRFPHINMEHTCWITPTNVNELCYRCNLKYKKTYFVCKNFNWLFNRLFPVEWRSYSFIYMLSIK